MENEYQEQQVTLNDYLAVIYRGRWIIGISFIVVMIATAYFTFTTQPVYEASAFVMYKEQAGVRSQVLDMTNFMKKETMINNQVVILKSRKLAEDVINQLLLSEEADSLWILGNRKDDAKFSLKAWLMSFIKNSEEEEAATFDDIVDGYRESTIAVAPQRDTDVIELKVQAFSPSEAALIANTWMQSYRSLDIQESTSEVKEVRSFLESKLTEIDSSLNESEQALKRFKENENVTELTVETQALIEKAAEFETLYQAAYTDYEANIKRISTLENQLDSNEKKIIESASSVTNDYIIQLERQRATLAGELAMYEEQLKSADVGRYFDSNMKDRQDRLDGLQSKIIEERKNMVESGMAFNPMEVNSSLVTTILTLQAENDYLKEKSSALWTIVKQYRDQLNTLPAKTLRLAVLQREVTVNNNIYSMMRQKFEENRIAEAGQIGQVRIIDYAKAPGMDEPIKPKKKMNLLLGLMLGLGLGVGITFAREYLDSSIKTIEDVEQMGLTVLGSIPLIAPQARERHIKENGNGAIKQLQSRLITHFAPKSPVSEAYRSLRTNILYSSVDMKIQTTIVTSSGPGEGKSTSICNLAIAFAQMGTKTLIIDADLRRPVLHGIFERKRDLGLTNVLVGNASFEEAVRQTDIENLSILTSGLLPPNPSELLASAAMDTFLEKVKEKYEMILFDSPPVIAVTDACVLARKLDGVLLVLKSGETKRDALSRARVLLDNVNANLFGITVNGVIMDRMYGSYYDYYHYYEDTDKKDKKKRKR